MWSGEQNCTAWRRLLAAVAAATAADWICTVTLLMFGSVLTAAQSSLALWCAFRHCNACWYAHCCCNADASTCLTQPATSCHYYIERASVLQAAHSVPCGWCHLRGRHRCRHSHFLGIRGRRKHRHRRRSRLWRCHEYLPLLCGIPRVHHHLILHLHLQCAQGGWAHPHAHSYRHASRPGRQQRQYQSTQTQSTADQHQPPVPRG